MNDCIFDLYGTLVDIRTDESAQGVWEKTARTFADGGARYQPAELRRSYARLVKEAQLDAKAHAAYPEIRLEYVFLQLYRDRGVNADLALAIRTAQDFRRASTRYIRLYDGVLPLLEKLRRNGKRCFLLSNAQSCFTRMELAQLGLSDAFDGILLSSECGCKKPDQRFYETLLTAYSIDPARAVMVGNDGLCDIAGAKAVGLQTVYLRTNLSPVERIPPADWVLDSPSMEELEKLLLE